MRTYTAARYFVAMMMLLYGFGKLNGSQFTVLDSQLDRPLGEVPGFWLTWYYFGLSRGYGAAVALSEIAGGALLLFRRGTLLGALLLLPVLGNIVLIDLFFGVDLGGLLAALVLSGCVLFILSRHADELKEVLWTRQNSVLGAPDRDPRRRMIKGGVCAAMVAFAFGFTWWLANYNNIVPTPLDGGWNLVQPVGASAGRELPRVVYFERNRAHMAVFRYDGRDQTHHFEVHPPRRAIVIYRDYLSRGPRLFEGSYALEEDGRRLRLAGRFEGAAEPTTLLLVRRQVAGRPMAG
jgi:hypothetical protein